MVVFFCLPYDRKKICSPVSPVFAYGNCLVSLSRITLGRSASHSFYYALCWVNADGWSSLLFSFSLRLLKPLLGSPCVSTHPIPRLARVLAPFSFLCRGTGKGGHAPTRRPVPPPSPTPHALLRLDAMHAKPFTLSVLHRYHRPSRHPKMALLPPFPNHLYPSRVVGSIPTTGSRLQTPNRLDRHTGVSVGVRTLLGEPARPHRDPHNPPDCSKGETGAAVPTGRGKTRLVSGLW